MNFPPRIGLGTSDGINGEFSDKDPLLRALRIGFRQFSFDENYRFKSGVLPALEKAYREFKISRKDIWFTLNVSSLNANHLMNTLKDFGLNYFDLVLIHNPTVDGIFESSETLEDAWTSFSNIDKRFFRNVGVANFYEPHLERLLSICERSELQTPYSNEIEMTFLSKNRLLVDYCRRRRIRVSAYTPSSYNAALSLHEDNETLLELTSKLGVTPAQVELAWIMSYGIPAMSRSTLCERMSAHFHAQEIVGKLPAHNDLMEKLKSQEDMFPYGVTPIAEESCMHGSGIDWLVPEEDLSCQMR